GEHSLHDDVLRHVELHDAVQIQAKALQDALELVGLGNGARETVEEETGLRVVLLQTRLDHADGHVVGHQVAGVHVGLGLEAQRRALADVRAEQIAGGNVGDAELLGENGGLGALAGTGGTKENESHYFKNPS